MLVGVKTQQPVAVAVQNRVFSDHFGVERCVSGDLTQKVAIVTVGAVHHGRYTQSV